MRLVKGGLRVVLVLVLAGAAATAQLPEYDWYPEFRAWVQTAFPPGQRQPAAIAQRYRQRLEAEGVAAGEIERRLRLVAEQRQALENDFWNRFFTVDSPTFNTAPNAFLVAAVEGRRPGRALDVGMGEGRNALYLAKLGWEVTGFDPADKAVALAAERAKALGLTLRTSTALDTTFDFGTAQWDLIVYSWVHPSGSVAKALPSLKQGGIVVVEAGASWFPPNGLRDMFRALRILHYEERVDTSDFFNRSEMPVVRLVAERPPEP